ncbi:solute carrier family 22 member 6 isoform X2 [Manacus candei]|uniref:solute carrier family 22 member 6 isoform X2 n=1 Tax=Manacus candei TaxID=415023 RepID=UPI002225D86B|nr:solute carrier family 22 member 6 isoform X2 [Manacus candei]
MSFAELLARLGGMGRFQVTYVAALAVPLLMLASHNLLQNFTAGVPEHHCRPRPAANASAGPAPLLVAVPLDGHRRPQRCRRYVELQWHLLGANGTANGMANAMVNGMANGTAKGMANGTANGMANAMVNGMANGMANAMVNGMANGMANAMVNGMANGMANAMVNGMANGMANAMVNGMVKGMANGMAKGTANGTAGDVPTEPCRDGWTYVDGVFTDTIITEWDLVCESRRLRQLAQSIYMGGILLGSGLFGVLSDKFGRRALLCWCYLQLGVTGVGTAAAPSFPLYCLLRFLTGLAVAGVSLNSASLCMEWIPTEARAVVGTINGYSYTLGQFVLAGAAFALPRWRQLQLVVSLPFFLFFLYSWLFVESARWQVTSGRADLALRGLRKVARINGRKEEGDKLSEEALRALVLEGPGRAGGAVAALVRTPGMRTVSCGVAFVWFSTSFAYYGLAMDLQGFGVDVYLSQLVFGAVDIPAKFLSVLAISGLGRRAAQGGALALAGLCILANILVPSELPTLRMALAVVGKGSLAASFNCAYIFTGELFPTIIRQTGMGLGGTMARVGGMVAPLVRLAADVTPALPLVIYGAAPLVSAVATALLPETRNVPLPETVRDVERRAGRLRDEDVAVPLSSTKSKDGA